MVMSWTESMAFLGNIIGILTPFLLGMLIAYFMNPMVRSFENKIIPKLRIGKLKIRSKKARLIWSIFISYTIFTSVTVVLLAIIIPQVTKSVVDFSNDLPNYLDNLSGKLNQITFDIGNASYRIDTAIISTYVTDNLPATFDQITNIIPDVLSFAKDFASGLLDLLIAYMVSIYLIASKETSAINTKRLIIALFPPKTARNIFDISAHAHKVFSNFFIGKLIDSFIIGLLCFIVLMIFNYPFALLLSVIIGITNIIPYFGPLIGGIIGFCLLVLASPVQALWFLLIILIIQQFDGNILGPWILGDSVGLSPFWIIFAIIIFGSMFGFIGMFLGAPLLSVIKYVVTKQIDGLYNRRTKLALEQVEHHNPID